MITVNSLSGGKTSSYLAIHYPADINIFSLVTIEAKYCTPPDKLLVKYVSDKIGKEFIATAESDLTLIAMFELEQKLGSEIIWVAGDTFEQIIRKKKALPNQSWRWCTTELKMKPIFEYLQPFGIVDMRLGIRFDEQERVDYDNTSFKAIVGKSKNGKRNKWKFIEWRKLNYPLVDERVHYFIIYNWAIKSGIIFPDDSNCVGCFWKQMQQLRKNWDDEPLKMRWFSEMEIIMNRKFKKEGTYLQFKDIGLQLDFNFGTGSGCKAGFCTN